MNLYMGMQPSLKLLLYIEKFIFEVGIENLKPAVKAIDIAFVLDVDIVIDFFTHLSVYPVF